MHIQRSNRIKQLFSSAASCILVAASVTACVTAPPYNPDHLDSQSFARISDICQTVMGLHPEERLYSGNWPGNSRLDYTTSHYRGCILSLSDTVQSIAKALQTKAADEDCRTKGFRPDTPELALCVLHAASSTTGEASVSPAAMETPASALALPPKRSFFTASPHEISQREHQACAALGISPAENTFKSCVEQLNSTFFAIDNPMT